MSKFSKENQGWFDDYLKFGHPDNFFTFVDMKPDLYKKLNDKDPKIIHRLTWKLNLIEEFAKELAVAMLKGTLKYVDDVDFATFQAEEYDERIDSTNYMLLKNHAEKTRKDG